MAITNTGSTSYAYDAGSCGGGLSQITFVPTITQPYRIRLFQNPCTVNAAQCGTFQVACNPPPPAPSNDEVAGAISLGSPAPVVCSMISGTTAWATQSASIPSTCAAGPCGSSSGLFSGFDVWYSVGVPALGNLSVILSEISAGPTTFAVYNSSMVEVACSCTGFISLSGLVGGSIAYIRVWPRSGSVNSGSFELCAYEPIPPPNDNPCGAVALPVGLSCNLTVFSTESATSLQAGMTTVPAAPSCGLPLGGGDVWFTAVMPASGVMTITSQAGTLTDMAMAVYTLTAGNICAPGTLTQVGCNDTNGASTMPAQQVNGAPGTTYYVRMWNKTAAFGTASICAVQNMPPPNDDPCGAIALPVNLGCTFGAPFSTQFATPTGNTALGAVSIPDPTGCPLSGAPYTSDVWFTAVVPASGQLVLDTDDGQLTNAAMAVYTAGGTSCPTLSLTQIAGACTMTGSANGAGMPKLTITQPPGTPVYIRIWRDGGNDGTFLLCARNPVVPAGCYYTLRLADSAGDGWNGGFVTLCVGGVCTNYTVYGSLSTIVFTASVGQVVTLSYTPVGGFQNQISYNLQASNGFNIFVSSNPPTSGFNAGFTVNAACNVPAAPIADCLGAFPVCSNQNISLAPGNFGNTQDLSPANRGCLLTNERQGAWYRFTSNAAGTIAFTIQVAVGTDYDFGVWGPPTWNGSCPPNAPPIRCNWSAVTGNTGLNYTSLNATENAGGPPFSRWIDALPNQDFLLYIDNYTMNGLTFLWSGTTHRTPSWIAFCRWNSWSCRPCRDHGRWT
ncbi:MAG: hypothetical protein IPI81_05165 [Flavobacteriales bacterium]|nr:hypothetical protein [Flavobacteriales bacterium]